ncbi:MAG: HNH endonuclease [Candidatus Acidiferrales bacterium]
MNISKPKKFRFPHEGWLRLNEQTAQLWSLPPAEHKTTILDDIVPEGTHIEKIRHLDAVMKELPPKQVFSVVMQTIRRDTQLIKALKELCDFRCQFPGCGERIRKRDGTFYVEVAHIKPVRAGGQSVLGNLLVLCPNHHKEFDHGDLRIEEQTVETLAGTLNSKCFEIRLPR